MYDEVIYLEDTPLDTESDNGDNVSLEILKDESINTNNEVNEENQNGSNEIIVQTVSNDTDYSNYLIDLNISLETFKQEYHDNYLESSELANMQLVTLNHVYSSINTLCMLLALFFVVYLLMGWVHEEK